MEILNNIWLSLNTSNIDLMNIIAIPITLLEHFFMMLLFIHLTNISPTFKKKTIYVLSMTFISLFTMSFIKNPFNVFINYIMSMILGYLIFTPSLIKSLICSVISFGIINLISVLIVNPYITILNITSDTLNSVPIYRLGYIFTIYVFVLIIILILKYKNLKFDFSEDEFIDKRNKIIIIFNLLLGIFTIIVQSITIFYYVDKLPVIITFLSFISLLAYFAVSIYSLTRIVKLILTTKKLQSEEEYNRSLRILHDSVRGFKHDFDNIVTTIGGYIKTNDMEGLKDYYNELEDDCQRVNNLYLLNPEVINNDGIYNLLTKKYQEAIQKGIKVNMTFLLDLNKLHMKIYEFARILGILLDNAIEASSECDEKIINLDFREDSKNSRQLIIVENTYKDKNIDTEKIFEKGISSKENHSGIGLFEVRKLIKKNNNLNLFTSKNDKFFSEQLEIYY